MDVRPRSDDWHPNVSNRSCRLEMRTWNLAPRERTGRKAREFVRKRVEETVLTTDGTFAGTVRRLGSQEGSLRTTSELIRGYNRGNVPTEDAAEVVVLPAMCHLSFVLSKLRRDFAVGAQDCSRFAEGGHSGEVTATALRDMGVKWVMVGQSERRHKMGEDDRTVAEKTNAATTAGLHVIACVGESTAEREAGETIEAVLRQLDAIVNNVWQWENIVIAYTPEVAEGAREALPPEEVQRVQGEIRRWMNEKLHNDVVHRVRIVYGGSVSSANCQELTKHGSVSGLLVGRASLNSEFLYIANCAMIHSGEQESEIQALRMEVALLHAEIAKTKGINEQGLLLEVIVTLKKELTELRAMAEFTTCTDSNE